MRSEIKELITKVRNEKFESRNTRFVIADLLDKINNEKFGGEDTYTQTQINQLIASLVVSGEYVPLTGTTNIKPFTGILYGKPSNTSANYFSLGGGLPELKISSRTVNGNNLSHDVSFSNPLTSISHKQFNGNSSNVLNSIDIFMDSSIFNVIYTGDGFGGNATELEFDKDGLSVSVYNGSNGASDIHITKDGLKANKYFQPLLISDFVQKKYVDDAVAGATPVGFIPLAGATNITGSLVATSYFTPSSANAFIQKKYVDDAINAIPPVTNYIPLSGASTITGALVATSYFVPSSANAFVQKKYVDDAISTIPPAPTNFIPLDGTSNITGALVATSYFAPSSANAFVQKKYVDDSINAIPPAPTNFVPLSGASNITGALVATSYFTPSSANAFIQKKYVDDVRSVGTVLTKTNKSFSDGTVNELLNSIVINVSFPLSGGMTQTFDLTSYDIKRIVNVSGYSIYDSGRKQLPLNSGHEKGIYTEFNFDGTGGNIESVTLSINTDAFDAEVTMILEYF